MSGLDEKRLDEKTVNSLKTMLTKSLPQRVRKKINVTYNDRTGRFSGTFKRNDRKNVSFDVFLPLIFFYQPFLQHIYRSSA